MTTLDALHSPLVSLVMATYRGDKLAHLQEAVESILGQTYVPIEFIVVINGPVEEDSRRYLGDIASRFPRVRLIHLEKNVGPARARNTGIAETKGEYIAVMDSDDIAAPERIERQLEFIGEAEADLVGSFYTVIDESGNALFQKNVPTTPDAVRRAMCVLNPIANSAVFARGEVLKRHRYPESFPAGALGEDYALWIELVKKGFRLANQPEYLVKFRADKGFLSRRRGWTAFTCDLGNKLGAMPLYPPYAKPIVLVACLVTSLSRLLPATFLRALYHLRNSLWK